MPATTEAAWLAFIDGLLLDERCALSEIHAGHDRRLIVEAINQ